MYITQSLKNIFMKLLSISQIFILSLTIMSSFYHNMQVTTSWYFAVCFVWLHVSAIYTYLVYLKMSESWVTINLLRNRFFYMNAHSFLNHHIIILLKQVTTLLLITLTHRFLVLTQIAMLTAKITYNQNRPRKNKYIFNLWFYSFLKCQLGYYTNLDLYISWKNPFQY